MRSPLRRRVLGAAGVVLLLGLLGLLLRPSSGDVPTAARPAGSPLSSWNAQAPLDSRAFEAPLQAAGTLTFAGQVLGPEGPVAGAFVVALPTPSSAWVALNLAPESFETPCVRDASAAPFLERVDAYQREAVALARATTDDQGRFRLEGLGPGSFVLWAEKGLLLGIHEGMSARVPEALVRVASGAWLTSQVLDEEGLPLEGVHVRALVHAAGRIVDTTTDAEGRFALGPLPDREEPLVLSKPGFLTAKFSLGDPTRSVARLSSAHRLSGRVLDERGPVAHATVRLETEQAPVDTVTTDEQGRFALEDLCASRYILVARAAGLVARRWVDVPPGPEGAAVDMLLAPAARLSGRVTDLEGQALAEAEVSANGGEPAQTLSTKTDAHGRFVLEPLSPDLYTVTAQAPRHVPDRITRLLGSSLELAFALKRAESLEGRVVDERDAPVRGAQLVLAGRPGSNVESPPALSDPDGHFVLDAPETGAWRVEVSHADFSPESVTLSAPARELRLVLRRGASVEARVVDEEGQPVENAGVSLAPAAQWARAQQEHTDARGRAVFRHLSPGDYTVQACAADPGPRAPERMSLAAEESRTVSLTVPRQGRLTGHVVDAQGRPVRGANLRLVLASSLPDNCYAMANVQSGTEGDFSLALPQGLWTLYAATTELVLDAEASRGVEPEELNVTEHSASVKARIVAGTTQVQLVLRPPRGVVRGRVVHEDGGPVTPFQLNGREVLDAEGRFVMPLREEVVRIEAPGLAPFGKDMPATLPPKDLDLGEIVLRPLRRVEGTVVDALGSAPIAGALVRVQGQEAYEISRQGPMAYTGQDGHFVLDGVRPSDTTLGVVHPLYPPVEVAFTPGPRVEVRLMPGATLEGRVASGGVPVEAGAIQLRMPGGEFAASTELRRGRYRLERIPAGRYTVHVQDPREDGSAALFPARTVELTAGGRTVLDFTGDPPADGAPPR